MCLSKPVQVVKLNGKKAQVEFGGKKREVDISLLKNIKIGDWLLVTQNLAINKISQKEAKNILQLVQTWHGK
jgi:hydrogenase expression/formation protein HypC